MRRYLFVLLLCICTATGCAVNPVTGKSELSLISPAEEIQIGAEQYQPSQQSQGGQFNADPDLAAYVSQVGQRVASVGDRELPYEFVVLNNSVPNAWALPGGKIAVNRGLLLQLNNEAELAAVLGHEAVHAAARHGANSMQRGMLLQGLLMATQIGARDSDFANYIVGGAQLGAQLISQKYGRSAELEADYYGIQYMARAGYDPSAAITLQETFVKLSEGKEGDFIDGLFASHPPSIERVNANRKTVAELGNPGGELGAERYQQHIAFLKKTRSAYIAFDEAGALAAKGELKQAENNLMGAIDRVPREARFDGLLGNIYYQQADYEKASRAYKRALALDDNYFEYHLGQGLVYAKQGNTSAAKQQLLRSNELLPTAVANNQLGELSLLAGNRADAKNYFGIAASNSQSAVGQAASQSFLQLDLTDNPNKYFSREPQLTSGGVLYARVQNLTRIPVTHVEITFTALVNGETLQRSVMKSIGAAETVNISSGWQFDADDSISNVAVTITEAQL